MTAQIGKDENNKFCLHNVSKKLLHKITDSVNLLNHWTWSKEFRGNTTVLRFLQGIRFHTQKKDEPDTTSMWSSKGTITTKTMLYKNMKATVHSPDGDTNFFNIVAGVLQGDTLASYLFIVSLDSILQTLIDLIKENGFLLKRGKNKISCRN